MSEPIYNTPDYPSECDPASLSEKEIEKIMRRVSEHSEKQLDALPEEVKAQIRAKFN